MLTVLLADEGQSCGRASSTGQGPPAVVGLCAVQVAGIAGLPLPPAAVGRERTPVRPPELAGLCRLVGQTYPEGRPVLHQLHGKALLLHTEEAGQGGPEPPAVPLGVVERPPHGRPGVVVATVSPPSELPNAAEVGVGLWEGGGRDDAEFSLRMIASAHP